MAFTLTPEREQAAQQLIQRYPVPRAACIPILHLCQQQEGWVSPEAIAFVAQKLGMTTSQVQGVVTFYTGFHQERVAPNVVSVCRTLSCDLRGGKIVQEHLEKKLGCKAGHTSQDGKFTLLKAECLAACGQAPMVQINDEFYENLTLEKLDQIIAEYARKTVTQPGRSGHAQPASLPPPAAGGLPPRAPGLPPTSAALPPARSSAVSSAPPLTPGAPRPPATPLPPPPRIPAFKKD